MKASVEIAGAFIRLHSEGDFGDPYVWCCGLRSDPRDITVAILGPNAGELPKSGVRPLMRALYDKGFRFVVWKKHGVAKRFEIAPLLPK